MASLTTPGRNEANLKPAMAHAVRRKLTDHQETLNGQQVGKCRRFHTRTVRRNRVMTNKEEVNTSRPQSVT